MGVRLIATVTVAASLVLSSSALADTVASTNWAGYAVHRAGVSFAAVEGAWRQPAVSCRARSHTFSSYWIGLGGYADSSNAIEQIGTEADCLGRGEMSVSAWYELLPQPSMQIALRVRPGDTMAALVLVHGHEVSFTLYDATTRRYFSRRIRASQVDLSSAEWIVEAPSECVTTPRCLTLPLAAFASASFTAAAAKTLRGHIGSITDPFWRVTKIALDPAGARVPAAGGAASTAGGAIVGRLGSAGHSFTVRYAASSLPGGAAFSGLPLRGSLRSTRLTHLPLLQ